MHLSFHIRTQTKVGTHPHQLRNVLIVRPTSELNMSKNCFNVV
jgi:hypothetical protein